MPVRLTHRDERTKLKADNFDSSIVEAARAYHLQIGAGHAKGYMPAEIAAFIAGACWARQILIGEKKE
jgi:hypothetical protein